MIYVIALGMSIVFYQLMSESQPLKLLVLSKTLLNLTVCILLVKFGLEGSEVMSLLLCIVFGLISFVIIPVKRV